MTKPTSLVQTIEASRALAAVLVVGFHIYKGYFLSAIYWPQDVFGGAFGMGHAGVELFFVISGMIMVKLHFGDLGRPGMTAAFCRKRFVRIYPFYWLCLAATVGAMALVPTQSDMREVTPAAEIGSWFLVGSNPRLSVMLVAWTLFHEMLFYTLFAVAIWRPLIGIMAMLAWICGSAVLGASGINLGYAFEFINILFGIGMIAGLVLRRGAVPMPALIGAIGIILFAATGFDDAAVNAWPRPAQIIGYGVGSALALVGIIEMERRGWLSFPRLALVIGAASYSIYLTHILVLALVTRLLRIFGLTLLVPGPLAFIALLVIAVAAGVAVHLTAERRIIEFVRRRLAQSVPMRASRQRIQPGA